MTHPASQPLIPAPGSTPVPDGAGTLRLDVAGEWISAEQLRSSLLQAQQFGHGIALDFGELRCSETTTLQVLLSAARSIRLTVGAMTDDLRTCLQAAGAASLLHGLLEVA